MLNETWQLWQALEKAKIPVESQHPLIKPLPTSEKNLLRVRLNVKGDVVSVEDVAEEERSGIRRIVRSSDGSFPVIKVNQPLLDFPERAAVWDDLGRSRQESNRIDLLSVAFKEAPKRSWADAGWQWSDSLDKANLLVEMLEGDEKLESIASLAQRFQKALQNETSFISEIGTVALTRLRTGRLAALKVVQELLVGKGKDNRGRDKKISVLLVLEFDEGGSVYTKQGWQYIADVLPTNLSATQRSHEHRATKSAFGGNGVLLKEPFPPVKLPVLGAYFPLVSMASDADKAKCNKRYGLTEYAVCPVTKVQSRRMQDALTWLVTREEGTTWRGVASGRFEMDARTHKKKDKRDLLIVFVDEKPDLDAKTASYFGSGSDIAQGKFEVDAKAVCDAFDAVVQEHPKSKLNLFLIREASDGQVQIALAESPFVKDVLDKAKGWQTAARLNVPDVTLHLQSETSFNKKTLPAVEHARPLAPYPDQVVRLLSHQWVRDGSSPRDKSGKLQKASQEIVGPGLGEVLALMLRMEGKWEPSARRMLNLLIGRVGPLLIGVFSAKHSYGPRQTQGKHEPLSDYPRRSRETALRAVAVLGILLDAFVSRKETYMKEVPYQVGQVLALADTLHKDYCIVVRKGQLPNSLIGTSLMRRALDNPASGLADISERMMEYIRWAKVVQVSQDWPQDDQRRIAVNEARKKLRQYQQLAEKLGTSDLPKECNDMMKAQLLLGFLASPPAEEQIDEGKEDN
ncbi:MAG: hypothetical protein FJ013_03460 [Chloroflexi bacterium]|nr:hypothetical protein [Deltaproteobacteria bacterium]MBM4453623.1 hypothetical protein [Chloroflexota bacterium]